MNYGIIAAGEGSRLFEEGIREPKPCVKVNGERLLHRLVRIFLDNEAERIAIILNSKLKTQNSKLFAEVIAEAKAMGKAKAVDVDFIEATPPSSMHSFAILSRKIADRPFIVTTVDTIFDEREFADYVSAFKQCAPKGIGLMGVTAYIDDEKPLYVECGTSNGSHQPSAINHQPLANITAFLDHSTDCRYISAGIYGLTPTAIPILNDCLTRGESRMRNFQRGLVSASYPLRAFPFGTVIDIDHREDIAKAETLTRNDTHGVIILRCETACLSPTDS